MFDWRFQVRQQEKYRGYLIWEGAIRRHTNQEPMSFFINLRNNLLTLEFWPFRQDALDAALLFIEQLGPPSREPAVIGYDDIYDSDLDEAPIYNLNWEFEELQKDHFMTKIVEIMQKYEVKTGSRTECAIHY